MLPEIQHKPEQTAASNIDWFSPTRVALQSDSGWGVTPQKMAKTTDTAQAHLPDGSVLAHDLSKQISDHEKQDRSKSYLARASDLLYRQDGDDLKKLIADQANINQKFKAGQQVSSQQIQQVEKDIADDKHSVKVKSTVAGVVGNVATIAPYFVPGPVGFALGTAANALDEANPNDSPAAQAGELALGGAKGVVKKLAVSTISELNLSPIASGALQGDAQRITGACLDHNTYINPQTGKVDMQQAGSILYTNVLKQSLNPTTLATDSVAKLGSDALAEPVGAAVDNLAARTFSQQVGDAAGKAISSYATEAARGAANGFASGTIHEAVQELQDHKFSPSDVLSNGTKSGAAVAMASVVGGAVKQASPSDSSAKADTATTPAGTKDS